MNLWSAYFLYGGAAGMIVTISLVIRYYKLYTQSNTLIVHRFLIILYILISMILMFATASIYLWFMNYYDLFIAIMVSNVTMVAWVMLVISAGKNSPIKTRHIADVIIVSLTLTSEIFMGLTYTLYIVGREPLYRLLLDSLNLPWFVIPMAAEALITYSLVRPEGLLSRLAPLLIINMIFDPVMIMNSLWYDLALYGSAVIMTITIVLALDYLYRHKTLSLSDFIFIIGSSMIMALMMGVQFASLLNATYWVYYGLTLAVDMAWYLYMYIRHYALNRTTSWLIKPLMTTTLLALIFIAETLMGGVISISLGFINTQEVLKLLIPSGFLTSLINIIELIALLTLSPGFLIMMGGEMGGG
ncbi:MAG: hypothetical protein ACP5NQ_04960 [Vulcanisaeta sp.]